MVLARNHSRRLEEPALRRGNLNKMADLARQREEDRGATRPPPFGLCSSPGGTSGGGGRS